MKRVSSFTNSGLPEEIRQFCRRYDATISPGEYRRAFAKPNFSINDYDYQGVRGFLDYDEIPTVNVTIPEREFSSIVEQLEELDSTDYRDYKILQKRYGNFMEILRIEDSMKAAENSIRSKNPGVKKAWENYQTMLKIAGG